MVDEIQQLLQSCPPEERLALEQRLAELQDGYQSTTAAIDKRDDLCQKFADYHDKKTAAESELAALQLKLTSPDLSPEDLEDVKEQLAAVQEQLAQCGHDSDELENLMQDTGLQIQERTGMKNQPTGAAVKDVMGKASSVLDALEQKKCHMQHVDSMMTELRTDCQALDNWSKQAEARLGESKLKNMSPEAIQAMADQLKVNNS